MMKWYKIEFFTMEPLIIGHENSGTEKYINGSTIRGIFVKEALEKLKFSKDIIFYDAYLIEDGKIFLPIPAVYEVNKYEYKRLVDGDVTVVNKLDPDSEVENPTKINADYVVLENKIIKEKKILLKEKLHINIKEKNMFRYEALEQGQKFCAYVKIKGENTEILEESFKNIFIEEKIVKLGKSRTTGYGSTKISKVALCDNIDIFEKILKKSNVNNKELILYFYTKAIFRNSLGETTFSPDDELEELFGKDKIELLDSFVNTEVFGGYNSFWKLELPKETGVKAGSVYRYKLHSEDNNLVKEKIKILEENGLGYFKERGFGMVIVNPELKVDKLIFSECNSGKNNGISSDNVEIEEVERMESVIRFEIEKIKLNKILYRHILNNGRNNLVNISEDVSNGKLYKLIDILNNNGIMTEREKKLSEYNDRGKISLNGDTTRNFMKKFYEEKEEINFSGNLKELEQYKDNKIFKEIFIEAIKYEIRKRKAGVSGNE